MFPAKKEAFSRIPETCPEAEKVYKDAVSDIEGLIEEIGISEQRTILHLIKQIHDKNMDLRERLRSVIIEVCEELLDEKKNVESHERDIDRLYQKIDDLTSDVKFLEDQLSSLEATS